MSGNTTQLSAEEAARVQGAVSEYNKPFNVSCDVNGTCVIKNPGGDVALNSSFIRNVSYVCLAPTPPAVLNTLGDFVCNSNIDLLSSEYVPKGVANGTGTKC